ncbi:MAG: PAS domain-containing sensor histidine kinase [Acidimicrobiia bacterium]|nr:PAS domain-containing sensor histidine kinase [Acidimicrobiia bacterium]
MIGDRGSPAGRTVRGLLAGLAALVVAIAVLLPARSRLDHTTDALVLLIPGVLAALVGGRRAAVTVSVASALAFNVAFLRPYGTLKVDIADDVVDLIAFAGVGLGAATLVGQEADRRREAERAAEEIRVLDRENESIRRKQEQLTLEARALELADAHRSALLRSVSHDLRTPLATIRAVASDLRDTESYDRATRNELLDLLADEAERLDRLVANLLSMSRIEAGVLTPERQAIALSELFQETVRRHRRLVRDKKVAFDVPLTLPLVDADWTLVEQVVTNLLDNAVRHAPAGSRIDLAARRDGDRWVRVTVADQGPGIPEREREAVFTPFRTGAGSASSGIGLAIAKAVVEAHGGAISVATTSTAGNGSARADGHGTTMAFTLPVHDA